MEVVDISAAGAGEATTLLSNLTTYVVVCTYMAQSDGLKFEKSSIWGSRIITDPLHNNFGVAPFEKYSKNVDFSLFVALFFHFLTYSVASSSSSSFEEQLVSKFSNDDKKKLHRCFSLCS